MAACLCWGGWFEVYGMILSVKVGFLYTEVVHLVSVLWIVMSRKFMWLFDSGSAVNIMLGWSHPVCFWRLCGGSRKLPKCHPHIGSTLWCCVYWKFVWGVRLLSFAGKIKLWVLTMGRPWPARPIEIRFSRCWKNSFGLWWCHTNSIVLVWFGVPLHFSLRCLSPGHWCIAWGKL